jgi:translation initiation factor 3 subunit G
LCGDYSAAGYLSKAKITIPVPSSAQLNQMTVANKNKVKWGDDEDEELGTDYETPIDGNGIKERIRIAINSKGQKVKITTRIKVREVKQRIPKGVAARRLLPKFGDAVEGEVNVTLQSKDLISIEHPEDQLDADVSDPSLSNTLGDFMAKLEQRKMERELDIDEVAKDSDVYKKAEGEEETKDGKYVPPGRRAGATVGTTAGFSISGKSSDGNENTLRVSNLTKSVTDDDLWELFHRFGGISRVSLPRGIDKEPRGFAYISFYDRKSAELALDKLQGYGYDHLILKLEWAKPPSKDPSQDNTAVYRSGYGTQLAQDTKEKVSYASNLTGNK